MFAMNENNNNGEANLSVYGREDAMSDFPVLKAFQQYIDNEQAKARRRLAIVCTAFGVLIILILIFFTVLLSGLNTRNRELNDKLVDYAMKDGSRQLEIINQRDAGNDAKLKAITDNLAAIQKELAEQREASLKAAREAAEATVKRTPSPEELELQRRNREESEKLREAMAQLEAEKKKLADEKEKMRQAEIERYKRRLYPEYYAREEGRTTAVREVGETAEERARKAKLAEVNQALADLESIDDSDEAESEVKPVNPVKPSAGAKKTSAAKTRGKTAAKKTPAASDRRKITAEELENVSEDNAIEYFKYEDEEDEDDADEDVDLLGVDGDDYEIPVEVKKGKPASKWRVPMK